MIKLRDQKDALVVQYYESLRNMKPCLIIIKGYKQCNKILVFSFINTARVYLKNPMYTRR